MTYTVLAADPASGLLGACQASSPMAVGSRCLYLEAGVGAVSSQGHTNPALGPRALDLLRSGGSAADALRGLEDSPLFGHRQVGIVDARGGVAAHTGTATAEHRGHLRGAHVVVLGNHLAAADVLPAMLSAWRGSEGQPFEARLLAAVQAGRDAGGDLSGNRSAALRVVGPTGLARTDLRVDWRTGRPDAVDELAALVQRWIPLVDYYQRRPLEPDLGDWEAWTPT